LAAVGDLHMLDDHNLFATGPQLGQRLQPFLESRQQARCGIRQAARLNKVGVWGHRRGTQPHSRFGEEAHPGRMRRGELVRQHPFQTILRLDGLGGVTCQLDTAHIGQQPQPL
jgi:hypothetical protein